jgi:hypothetical protein
MTCPWDWPDRFRLFTTRQQELSIMKRRMHIRRGLLGATAAVAVLFGSAEAAGAQTVAPPPPSGRQEGIKVHGHWVVEVRNPDGTLADRREFNNALHSGALTLTTLLTRRGVPGRWELTFGNTDTDIPPCQGGTGASLGWCSIIENAATNQTAGATAVSRDLVVTHTPTSLTLTGTITALVNGIVGRVATRLGTCDLPATIDQCGGAGDATFFTDAVLGVAGKPPKVPVVAGQIIKLTVTITFS